MQVKAKYTNVPVQTNVRQSQQTRGVKNKHQTERNHQHTGKPDKLSQANKKEQATPTTQTTTTKEGGPKTPTRTKDNEAGRQDQTQRGRGGSRQAETRKQERADAREGSRGRKEKATQAKVGACGFSGVQRGFWITRGQIPQRRSEGHMNNTHSMVERAKPHTGPKPLLP